jgi:NAD(P)-dependent dehydrogenase (short-subunit alcohol dehydrogenase family)
MKVWFVTGASRGLGRIWTEAALERGDKVVATARRVSDLDGLKKYGDNVLALELDVTHPTQAEQAVRKGHAHFGRLDVVLNNAGYSLLGTHEEVSIADTRALFETNYFGALRVIQAALPLLRAQRSGHIVGVSSGVGLVSMPLIGTYCASKFAFEALHESLAAEVRGFGIKVTLLEPNAYATEFGGSSTLASAMPAYEGVRAQVMAHLQTMPRGNPHATSAPVLRVLDEESPPLRFLVGSVLPFVQGAYESRMREWREREALSNAAQG